MSDNTTGMKLNKIETRKIEKTNLSHQCRGLEELVSSFSFLFFAYTGFVKNLVLNNNSSMDSN